MNLDILVARPVRNAARSLVRSPGFTATAVLSVGGAIGLACSVYAVIAATFFAALPHREPERLVEFWQTERPGSSQPSDYLAPDRMDEWVRKADFRTLEAVAATGMGPTLIFRSTEQALKVTSAPVLGDWFRTLGVPVARGRVLTLEDLRPGAPPAAVVSDAFWREYMGGADLHSIVLSGLAYSVVGVTPSSLTSARTVWIPVESLPTQLRPAAYAGVGRLKAGVSAADAAAEVEHLASVQVESDSARYAGLGATTRPLGQMGRGVNRAGLWMLAGVVLAVLLVALNNLTVLTLVRAQSRTATLAVRAALGASRWELGRGLAAEGALVGFAGALLGLGLAFWGKDAAAALVAGVVRRPVLGPGSVGLAVGLGALVAMMIGIEPMRRMACLNLREVLQRRSGGAGSTPGERRTRRALVSIQVGVCVVLLAVATVLAAAYEEFGALQVGIDSEGVVEIHPDWEVAGLDAAAQWALAERVADRLERSPEVHGTTAWRQLGEDYPPRPEFDAVTDGPSVELGTYDGLYRYYEVLPSFFVTLGIDLVRGRPFTASDGRGTEQVAIVTERAARLWWPGMDPIGRQIKLGQGGSWMTVVGVSRDIQQLDELGRSLAMRRAPSMPLLFLPAGQFRSPPVGWRSFECCSGVRIGARPAGTLGASVRVARQVLAQEAPDLPLLAVGSLHDRQMQGYVGQSIATNARLVALGLVIAMLLAVIGIVGVVSEAVSRRTREIGVRVALGAGSIGIVWTIVRESVSTIMAGLTGGLLALLVLRTWMTKVVFDLYVQRLAPGVLSFQILGPTVIAVLTAIGVAGILTARRALRVNPADALRAE